MFAAHTLVTYSASFDPDHPLLFPQIYQAKLFENEMSRVGKRCYGCSIHYHYISETNSSEAYDGSKMVHSAVTEMIANVRIRSSRQRANQLSSCSRTT